MSKMDERQKQKFYEALTLANFTGVVLLLVRIFYVAATTGNIMSAGVEIGVLVIGLILLGVFSFNDEVNLIPKSFPRFKELPTGASFADFRKRIFGALIDSAASSVFFMAMDFIFAKEMIEEDFSIYGKLFGIKDGGLLQYFTYYTITFGVVFVAAVIIQEIFSFTHRKRTE